MPKEMTPLVTAVIPNYNYSRYLADAVGSALNQTYENLEVIVVDDGSTDDSLKVLEQFSDRIKVIAQQNAGVSAARNNGVAAGAGEYLAFLDADDVWHPEKIKKQVERFASEPSLGMVHVGVRDIDADGRELRTLLDGMQGDVAPELLISDRPVILGGGSGIMITRRIFDDVGGFDQRLSTCADWDIFYQMGLRSKVAFIPYVLLDYRFHGSNMHGNLFRTERDAMLCLEKAFSSPSPQISALRDQAYGKSHLILSGSYYHAGEIYQSLLHGIKAIYYKPKLFGRLIRFILGTVDCRG